MAAAREIGNAGSDRPPARGRQGRGKRALKAVTDRSAKAAAPRRLRVLVVEHDARTARLLAHLLEDDGYEAEVSTDGVTAINRLGQKPAPDVLMTDIALPHLDGRALARYARSMSPDIQVVLITAYPDLAGELELSPPAHVLTKPLNYAELQDTLGRAGVASGGVREAKERDSGEDEP